MSSLITNVAKQIYNVAERALLDPFKQEYITSSTPETRKQMFLSRIWPTLYTYWIEKEGEVDGTDVAERAKSLGKWIHNNWRLPHRGGKKKCLLIVKRTDILWNDRRAEVFMEIAKLLGVVEASTRTAGWFTKRSKAMGNMIGRMTKEQLAELDAQVEEIQEHGYSEDQRRAYAEKYCTQRLDDSGKAHWLEMGMLKLSVVAYRRVDGKLCVEIHEDAANLVGIKERCFEDEYEGKASEMKRIWLDYVRNIYAEKTGGVPTEGAAENEVNTSPDGFPLLPDGIDIDQLSKREAEKLARTYLRKHYSLASGGQSEDVPYKEMEKGSHERRYFVDDPYLPNDLVLRDPHNMKRGELLRWFKHLLDRQATHPAPNVFRFRAFRSSRRQEELLPTVYPDEVDSENPPPLPKKRKRAKRSKQAPKAMQIPQRAVDPEVVTGPEVVPNSEQVGEAEEVAHPEFAVDPERVGDPEVVADNNRVAHPEVVVDPEAVAYPKVAVDPEHFADGFSEINAQGILAGDRGNNAEEHVGTLVNFQHIPTQAQNGGGQVMQTFQSLPALQWNFDKLLTMTPEPVGNVGPDVPAWGGDYFFPENDLVMGGYVADHSLSLGANNYGPGDEGIDYGVPINLVNTEVPNEMYYLGAPRRSDPVWNEAIPRTTASPLIGSGLGPSGYNNPVQANWGASASTVPVSQTERKKRTADDLAAAEADVLPGTTKRIRKPKVRDS